MINLIVLAVGMFALGIDAYVVAGLLPGITHSFSISAGEAGQSVTTFTLCYAVAAPVFAAFLGGKSIRSILMLALGIFILANGASALASNFAVLLAARAIAGLGAGLFSPVAVATAAALAPVERKGRALGMTLGGMSAGTVIGVPAGLLISDLAGWRTTLLLVSVIGLVALIGVWFRFPMVPLRPPPSMSERLSMLAHRNVATTVGISFLTAVGSLGLYTYVAPILHVFTGSANIKPYLWVWGLGGLAGSFAIGPLIDRTGRPAALLTVVLVILSLSLLSIPTLLVFGPPALIPFFVWGAMGWSSLAPQQHALLALQPDHGTAAVALNSSCNYLGSAVGTMIGGALIAWGVSPATLPFCAAGATFAALAGHLSKQYLGGQRPGPRVLTNGRGGS